MTQQNTLNAKLYKSQINRLKSGITNGAQVTLNLSSNAVGESYDETNFPCKFLLTDTSFKGLQSFCKWFTLWKVSKYGVFSGPYFFVLQVNTDHEKLRI